MSSNHCIACSILDGYSVVDKNFVGSSGNLGRIFARTVRSTDCEVISHSKVTDTCGPCSELYNVVINRSLLVTPARGPHQANGGASSDRTIRMFSPPGGPGGHRQRTTSLSLGSTLDARKMACKELTSRYILTRHVLYQAFMSTQV